MINDKDKSKNIPAHIAIIMDGNRRWAKERNLSTLDGHQKGYQKMMQVPDWFFLRGVKILTFYAFSNENWNREPDEVNYLMKLLQIALTEQTQTAVEKNQKILVSGRIEDLPGDLPESCYEAIAKTKGGTDGIINVCLNYGGRQEILDAIRKIIKNNIEVDQIHEGMIRKYLYNGELPDPDIILRTSGEQRLSGFLTWQSVYSELIFLKKYWPDFEDQDVDFIINEYNNRQRRFGGQ